LLLESLYLLLAGPPVVEDPDAVPCPFFLRKPLFPQEKDVQEGIETGGR
jgi:hypothetical protein